MLLIGYVCYYCMLLILFLYLCKVCSGKKLQNSKVAIMLQKKVAVKVYHAKQKFDFHETNFRTWYIRKTKLLSTNFTSEKSFISLISISLFESVFFL